MERTPMKQKKDESLPNHNFQSTNCADRRKSSDRCHGER
jgi:hypothetical protein